MIAIRHFSYRFRGSDRDALSDINLDIAAGEFVVLTGPSGCGKSTLALALGGFLFNQFDGDASGAIHVAGMNVQHTPIYDVAEVVGLVQQNPEAQFCTLTVQDEIAFGLENRLLPRDEIHAHIHWALDVVGAQHLRQRDLAALSGGEKQRVAIAAMLATRPRILIFDEPTSNLDPTATAAIFDVIARIRELEQITVIVIEHKTAYLRRFAPRWLRMNEGRIVEQSKENLDTDSHRFTQIKKPVKTRENQRPEIPLVRTDRLYAGYDGHTVLHDVSVEIGPGEFVAVMGDNGSGKTTFLQCLLGLRKPDRGSVEVMGLNTHTTPVSQLAQHAAFVFQNPDHQLFAETVWQEATLAPRNFAAWDATAEAQAIALLDDIGLAVRHDDHPYRLSYGEKRRLNLAAMLTYAPRLLLLDEILIGQDPANAQRLLAWLQSRVDAGDTVILINHAPDVTQQFATRVLFFDQGRLHIDAPAPEAFAQLAAQGRTAYLPTGDRPAPDHLPPTDDHQDHVADYPTTRQPDNHPRHAPRTRRRITFHPGDSLLHRLHPLVKLAWLAGGTIAVFAVQQPAAVIGVLVAAALAFPLNRLALHKVRGMWLFAVTALTLFLLQALFAGSGADLLRIGPLTLTADGIARGVYVAGRLLSVVLLSYLFVLTTEPNDLAYALMRAGLPYRYGFVLITALRLVPVFEQEAQIVYQAQLARGIAYDRGGVQRFFTLARQFFLPLLVSAMSKVDALAVSMEGRCFSKYPRRTFLREVRFAHRDTLAIALLILAISVVWWLNG